MPEYTTEEFSSTVIDYEFITSADVSKGGYENQVESFTKTATSWSYTTPSSWQYVALGNPSTIVGANCTYKIKWDGIDEVWSFIIDNNYA